MRGKPIMFPLGYGNEKKENKMAFCADWWSGLENYTSRGFWFITKPVGRVKNRIKMLYDSLVKVTDSHNALAGDVCQLVRETKGARQHDIKAMAEALLALSEKVDALARYSGMEFQDRDSLNKHEMVKPKEEEK